MVKFTFEEASVSRTRWRAGGLAVVSGDSGDPATASEKWGKGGASRVEVKHVMGLCWFTLLWGSAHLHRVYATSLKLVIH